VCQDRYPERYIDTWGKPLAYETTFCILALIPSSFRFLVSLLEKSSPLPLVVCSDVEEFVRLSKKNIYAVVLVPAEGISSHEWWSLWGAIRSLDQRPSILVCSLDNDFRLWAGVLAAGGFDVISAPFTAEKMQYALHSAADDFQRKFGLRGQ
jgi:hypothetical protein